MHASAGIASIGLSLPPLAMQLDELARLRGVDPAKYKLGLGCEAMALCPPGFGAELLLLRAGRLARDGEWAVDIDADLQGRRHLDGPEYSQLRG